MDDIPISNAFLQDEYTLLDVMRSVIGKFSLDLENTLPAKVISFDRERNRVVVQPLILMVMVDGTRVARAEMAEVPVYELGGGGFIVNFPLKPGDLGWIRSTDRDISLFLQTYEEASPNTLRRHSFSDAVFFPDVMTNYTIAQEDADKMVIQTLDGSQKITISDTGMAMVTDKLDITVSGKYTLTANEIEINAAAAMVVDAETTWTGDITSDSVIKSKGVELDDHDHGGVQRGVLKTLETFPA